MLAVTDGEDRMPQDPAGYGLGRLFWISTEAVVGADVRTERITLWNPAASRLFGYADDEAIGMPLDRLVPDELDRQHHQGLARYRETGVPKLIGSGPVEVPAITKLGRRIHVALTLTAVPEHEEGRFVVAIIRDITAQKEAEADLRRVNQAMKTFVATASHDLRTPLTTVLGFAKLLETRGGELNDQQRSEFGSAIHRAAQQASRLVDDLLTLSKIEARGLDVRHERVALHPALRQAVEECSPGATVSCDDATTVWVDPDHLHRMLANYLSNAVRYGAPPVEVSTREVGDNVEIRVSDRGDGVPAEFVDRLFTSFARGRETSPDGTGLGLSIVKGLAEANGGDAFYEPRAVGGACFGVRLSPGPPATAGSRGS